MVVDRILAAVLPEYKGRHISTMLFKKVVEDAKNGRYKYIESQTAEHNDIVQKINLKDGYKYIAFTAPPSDHYNVIMLQWLDKCPYSDIVLKLHYGLQKLYIKTRFKPGRKKRFGI